MANEITVAAPLTTADFASQVLATMAALSGTVSDYNVGAQLRTQVESEGSVVDQQSVWTQAIAFQALVYSALSLWDVSPGVATAASGAVLFVTSPPPSSGVPASQNVAIPSGTVIGTAGGVQFATTAAALLTAGSSGISVPAQAVVAGTAGNVPASGITQIITNPPYPLFVTNPQPMAGGAAALTPAQTTALFAAKRAAIGLSSPGAIANAAIGVIAAGTNETCLYSTCYEPWLAAGSGAGSGTAGYQLYIDNGTGAASSGLILAVRQYLNGGAVSGGTAAGAAQGVGFRDAGVPYQIFAVAPTIAVVAVTGSVNSLGNWATVSSGMAAAIDTYFTLPFGTAAEQAQISAAAANAGLGYLISLTVTLTVSGSSTPVSGIVPSASGRVVLGSLLFTQGP